MGRNLDQSEGWKSDFEFCSGFGTKRKLMVQRLWTKVWTRFKLRVDLILN